jgi:hypothetical protein
MIIQLEASEKQIRAIKMTRVRQYLRYTSLKTEKKKLSFNNGEKQNDGRSVLDIRRLFRSSIWHLFECFSETDI